MPARPAAWSLARASLSAPPHAARRSTLHASGDREARGEGRPPPWRAHRPEKWSAVWPYNWTLLAHLLVRSVGRMTINDAPKPRAFSRAHSALRLDVGPGVNSAAGARHQRERGTEDGLRLRRALEQFDHRAPGRSPVDVDPPHRVAGPGAVDEQLRLGPGRADRRELLVEVRHEVRHVVQTLTAGGEELRVRRLVVERLEQFEQHTAERAERDPQRDRRGLAVHQRLVEARLVAGAHERAGAQARTQFPLRGDAVAHDPADVEQHGKLGFRHDRHPSALFSAALAVSTTHTRSPTWTSLPSGTACSTMTPSPVASTSWLIFSVSISYRGSPLLNASPGCRQNRTMVASSMVMPILGSLTRTRIRRRPSRCARPADGPPRRCGPRRGSRAPRRPGRKAWRRSGW